MDDENDLTTDFLLLHHFATAFCLSLLPGLTLLYATFFCIPPPTLSGIVFIVLVLSCL